MGQVINCELVKPDIDLRADEQSRRFEVQVMSFPWISRSCDDLVALVEASGNDVRGAKRVKER